MNLKHIFLCGLISFVNSYSVNFSSGNTARLQIKIYKELGLIDNNSFNRYIKSFDDEVYYEKLNGSPPVELMKIIEIKDTETNGKCAYIGICDSESVFKPTIDFVISEPDIRKKLIHECLLDGCPVDINLEYLKNTPSYLEYLFTYK